MDSVENTAKLLKLHLQWPDRNKHAGADDEALLFYKWMFMNHFDRPEVEAIDSEDDVAEFIQRNEHVLRPDKKTREQDKWANLRREPRIENDVKIILSGDSVDDFASGRTLDLGLHGIRLTTNKKPPEASTIGLVIEASDDVSYNLTGETMWVVEEGDQYQVGVRIIEDDEFVRWQADFGARFVSPKIARPVKRRQRS